jgi:hypothetical protein
VNSSWQIKTMPLSEVAPRLWHSTELYLVPHFFKIFHNRIVS